MSSAKKKPPANPGTRRKEQVNIKALIWVGVAFGLIVAIMAVLLILDI